MATETSATQAKRILVVEDEPMIRMLAGCRCPRYPRHAVRLCHGLWPAARALSRPADAKEAVPNGWA